MSRTKRKPESQLPGEWSDSQYEQAEAPAVLWLPEPQERFVHPEPPGKRTDGKLWFEGPTRRSIAGDKVTLAQMSTKRLALDGTELKMRDFRKGDRWLPWHFKDEP